MAEEIDALVIGAGPAGLMAADALAAAGRRVVIAEHKPSAARKFLMAGKSGLNLTKDEPFERFLAAYGGAADRLRPMLEAFGPAEVCRWAEALGQPVFTGSTGRVFPVAMKASPLLRTWLARLDGLGATLRTRWRWTGWDGADLVFATPAGAARLRPGVTVLALGGASWARLGSDGAWAAPFSAAGLPLSPFRPANAGLRIDWPETMARQFGQPVKGAALQAGPLSSRGEFVISRRGLEGGGIYAVMAAVRDGAALTLDLLRDRSADEIARRLARPRGKASLSNHLRKALRLDPARLALLRAFAPHPLPEGAALAALIKALPVRHSGPRPLGEAISTAGGLGWEAVDGGLMLSARPGTFAAGEMLDWEAPTGGYLLTACLATGLWAGRHAVLHAAGGASSP
jgi:uncharacterized flavoprotein (TIGR03862 family)